MQESSSTGYLEALVRLIADLDDAEAAACAARLRASLVLACVLSLPVALLFVGSGSPVTATAYLDCVASLASNSLTRESLRAGTKRDTSVLVALFVLQAVSTACLIAQLMRLSLSFH